MILPPLLTSAKLLGLCGFWPPRWLWPSQPRPAHGLLHPHSRRSFIRERAHRLRDGNWRAILTALGLLDAPTCQSGLLTPPAAKSFLAVAKQGRLTSAWRRLWSYGIAPPGPDTILKLQSKWHPPASHAVPSFSEKCLHIHGSLLGADASQQKYTRRCRPPNCHSGPVAQTNSQNLR